VDGHVSGIAVEFAAEKAGNLEVIERFLEVVEFFDHFLLGLRAGVTRRLMRVSSPRKGSIKPRRRETFSTSAWAFSLLSQKPGSAMRPSTAVSSDASLS
jgi:hypothetical protein